MHKMDLAAVLRRSEPQESASSRQGGGDVAVLPADALEWSWPPYAPVESDAESFDTAEWAPASVVWHPHVRVGRWTVVYRR